MKEEVSPAALLRGVSGGREERRADPVGHGEAPGHLRLVSGVPDLQGHRDEEGAAQERHRDSENLADRHAASGRRPRLAGTLTARSPGPARG
jgi:hypothetical protein